jgi:hypothetical protein
MKRRTRELSVMNWRSSRPEIPWNGTVAPISGEKLRPETTPGPSRSGAWAKAASIT